MADFLAKHLPDFIPAWIAYFLVGVVHFALILTLILIAAAAFTWAERKVSA